MKAPRRVVLVVGQLQMGGAERQLYELAARLDRARHEPFVACLSQVADPFAARLRDRGIGVQVLPRAMHYDLSRVYGLARLLRQRKADLAHSFLLAANAYTGGASLLAGLPGHRIPFISSSRTCIPPARACVRLLHRRAFLASSAVIANSRRVMEFTRDHYGLRQERFRVIHNGIDPGEYPPASDSARAAARLELGVPQEAILIGSLGRLSPEKNLDLFLDAAARLAAARSLPQVRFVLVGEGPAREILISGAAGRRLQDLVHFPGAREDVAHVLSAFDIFVLTSDTEGLPNAVMEAMAARLPVVATRAGGTHEVVEEGITGYLVERGDLDALADRIMRLIADPAGRRSMGERGRARIESDFSVEKMVARTSALYDEVLD